jgi:hypothetical protein
MMNGELAFILDSRELKYLFDPLREPGRLGLARIFS